METKELRSKSESDLRNLLDEKRVALRTFRFASGSGKAKNVKEGRALRKDIAQILTVLKELAKVA